MKPSREAKTKQVHISPDLHRRAKIKAAKQERTLSEIVNSLLEAWLKAA